MIKNLTKKQYLGEGYVHVFISNTDGSVLFVPCEKADYDKLSGEGGVKNNPVLDGYTWHHSEGGTIKVDNPDTVLKENEYTDFEGDYFVVFKEGEKLNHFKVDKKDVKDDKIDITKITKK